MSEAPETTPERGRSRFFSVWALAAVLAIGVAYAVVLRPTGCGANSQFALVRALDHGHASIDEYHWQTCDKSYTNGHFYSNKAPGLAFFALPVWAALDVVGLAHDHLPTVASTDAVFDDLTAAIWPLVLWGTVLPLLLMLLLVRAMGEELEPGYGTAAAVTLGVCTLVLSFGSAFVQHGLSSSLGLAAFFLLWVERRGPPRLWLLAAAGLIAGYGAMVEYPLGLIAIVLGLYAIVGRPRLPARAAVYSASCLVGVAPLLVYNKLAFGSVTHLSYVDLVLAQGQSGHDRLGAQSQGIYGITSPRLQQGLSLLFGHKGMFILTPIVLLALCSLVAMWRRGRRAEVLVTGAIAIAFWGYDTGFSIGGDVPGPRYLIPALPFLAPGLAIAWRAIPVTTFVLAAVSALSMVVATITGTSWGGPAVWPWFVAIGHGHLTKTVLTWVGAGTGWVAAIPFFAALAFAVFATVKVTPRPALRRQDVDLAVAALAGWLLLAGVAPTLLERSGYGYDAAMLLLAAAVGIVVWQAARRGMWVLAAAVPLLALLAPSLARDPGAVAIAAGIALFLSVLLEAPRRRWGAAGA